MRFPEGLPIFFFSSTIPSGFANLHSNSIRAIKTKTYSLTGTGVHSARREDSAAFEASVASAELRDWGVVGLAGCSDAAGALGSEKPDGVEPSGLSDSNSSGAAGSEKTVAVVPSGLRNSNTAPALGICTQRPSHRRSLRKYLASSEASDLQQAKERENRRISTIAR